METSLLDLRGRGAYGSCPKGDTFLMVNKCFLFLYPKLQRLLSLTYVVAYECTRLFRPVCPNSVILATNRTQILTDNLRYVFDRIDHEKYHVRTFFLSPLPTSRASLFLTRLRFVAAMAITQYTLVDDVVYPVYAMPLRSNTRLIQIWHALGALKRMGFSRRGINGGPPHTSITHKNYTDVIVSSEPIRGNFAEAFGVRIDIVHATGAPRSDFFFNGTEQDRASAALYAAYPVLQGKRVILFAPTFRGEGKRTAYYPADYLDLDRIHAGLSENDIFILRMHPFVKSRIPIPAPYRDTILDLSDYPEFNHLLVVCDLLITDYSSAIFDYALLDRPVVFYTPDLDEYRRDRGFYYDFSEYAYGPVVRDMDSLIPLLGTTTIDERRRSAFCKKFLDACDGHATEKLFSTVFSSEESYAH